MPLIFKCRKLIHSIALTKDRPKFFLAELFHFEIDAHLGAVHQSHRDILFSDFVSADMFEEHFQYLWIQI